MDFRDERGIPDLDLALKYFISGHSLKKRLHRRIRKACLVSESHPQSHAIFKSPAGIANEQLKHLGRYGFMIHPFSKFRLQWETFMIFVLTISLILIPYHVTFNFENRNERELEVWMYIMLPLDFFCLADIIVTFLTGYYKVENKEICLDYWFVARNYLRNLFVIDLLSSLPVDWVLHLVTKGDTTSSVTRFYVQLMTLIKAFRISSLLTYINNWILRHAVNHALARLLRTFFLLMLYIHWMTCLTYLIPLTMTFDVVPAERRTWLAHKGLWTMSNGKKYINCLYRSMSMLFNISFGKNPPTTLADMFFAIISAVLGFVFMVVIIAQLDQLSRLVNTSEVKYAEKVVQLREYMQHKKMPGELQRRIMEYYPFKYQLNFFKENELLNTMTKQLRQDVMLHSCRRMVENVTFFNNLPTDLLVSIVKCLRSEIYLTNDVIVKARTEGDSMFFISTGTVAVYSPAGLEVCHLEDGAHFGEIGLVLEGYSRIASVVAVESCEVYRLDRNDFLRVVSPYPDLLSKVEEIAVDRMEKTMQIDDEYRYMNPSNKEPILPEKGKDNSTSSSRMSSRRSSRGSTRSNKKYSDKKRASIFWK